MENGGRMTICKLSSEVQSALRSGVVFTSVAQCVDELVFNAVDAGATLIAVRINFKFHKIQVIDNGCGMNSAHLDLVGTRYMTSKCHSIEDLHNRLDQFGFRGEALASLREVSGLLTLESRPKGSDITFCKVFTHGKSHKAGVSKTVRPEHGTTITVHDFMYNMPVRRQRIRSAIDLEEIKSHIECTALMQPQISFSLRNDTDGNLILHTRKSADTISAFSYLFGQTVAQTLVTVSSTLDQFKISGYIGKEAHHQKNLQFVYVNKRLVLKSKFHKLANSMLGNSFILKSNITSRDIPISKETTTGRWLAYSSPRKRDKYAVYLLNVECPYHLYDICLDPKKTLIEFCNWDKVLQCMESVIRTFLEKEYSMSFSQGSNICSQNEKSNGKNISSLLKEMEQLEKECALGQLKTQHVKSTEMLNREKESNICNLSEIVNKKMLNVSRALFGMPAKRREKSEDSCYKDDICLQNTTLTFEEIDVESEVTVMLDSSANRSDKNVLTDFTPNHTLHKCESENPFSSSQIYNITQQSITSLTGVLKRNETLIARKNLNKSRSCLFETPLIESDCEKLSPQCTLTGTDSDLYPVERFRNFISHRTQPKYQSKHVDLPPITKFRETFHCLSNIEIPIPFKNSAWDALQLYYSTSETQKRCVDTTNECDKPNINVSFKTVAIDNCETAQENFLKGEVCSHIPTHLKCLLHKMAMNQDLSTMCNKTHYKECSNYEQQMNHLVHDASETLSNESIAKPVRKYENTEKTEGDVFNFQRNTSHCSPSFPSQSLRRRDGSNLCVSSGYRGPLCNELNIPRKEIIEVEECVQFQQHNNFHNYEQKKRETNITTTTSDVRKRCVRTSHAACNNERNCIKMFDLASTYDVGKVKEHWNSMQRNHSTLKATDKRTDGRDMSPLAQNSEEVCNWLKLIHHKINAHRRFTKAFSTDYSYSRDYCTSSDFLCTLEREKAKKSKCTLQNGMLSIYHKTDFQDDHAAAKTFSCHEKSHNTQACNKSVGFNSTDKMVFHHNLPNNFEGNSQKMLSHLSSSDCALHNVNVVGKCDRPSLGAVTFRFSPKLEMRHHLGCMDIKKLFDSNSDMICKSKLRKKNIQNSEIVKNHYASDCARGISQVVFVSDYAVSRQQLGKSIIFSSGSEADVESGNEMEPCFAKRRRINMSSFNKNCSENKRLSKPTNIPKDMYAQHIHNNCSEESLKRKTCYSITKCENWKMNTLSKERLEGSCLSFEGQEKTVEYLSPDRQEGRNRVDGKISQTAVDGKMPQIIEGSNDTIVPSSGSSCNSSFSCLHQTPNCKIIVSDSSSDLSLHNCNIVRNQDSGNLCSRNSLAVSSNGKEADREAYCSGLLFSENEEGNVTVGTDDIFVPFGKDLNEVETRTIGIMNNYFCKEPSSENVYREKVYTDSSAALSDVISTLKICYISHSASNKNNANSEGNENNVSETENVDSVEKTNMLQKILPTGTIVQEVSKSHYSDANNETNQINDTGKNNSESISCEKEQLFSKWSLPSSTIKCRISSDYKCIREEASELLLMEKISSGHGQLLSSKELSPKNTEHCGALTSHNCMNDESTQEVPSVGKMCCAQENSSFFKDSLSRTVKNDVNAETFSLVKANDTSVLTKDTLSYAENVFSGLHCSFLNDRLPSRNNTNQGVPGSNSFIENDCTQTLRQNIFNSESSSCKHSETHSFSESTQCNSNKSTNNANICDRESENGLLNTDLITCGQMTDINTTESEIECHQAEQKIKLNECVYPAASLAINGNKLREMQSNLLDRKRRCEVDCPYTHAKRNCTEEHNLNVATRTHEPYESNLILSEVNMSNTVSTQDLNEAFDRIMNNIAGSDANKQENYATVVGQDDVVKNSTVGMNVCKEIEKISHSAEDVDMKRSKEWEQRLDPKGKIFFVHVESGLTSYAVPNHVMTQNLYSMSKRFAFLPKGMSPVLRKGVNKSYEESEEKNLTPVSHQVLCNIVTDSYSLMDELSSVKWKDVQEPKRTSCTVSKTASGLLGCDILKMEAVCSSETLVPTYKSMQHHKPEDHL
ncbi:uncharacterized protein LOC110827319 isoform X2 [Zootermopsis nevadensis]|uniref:uncharacterized protein LOC110827319 isoform X2 n=1 Tax=Zootermopsis nevadensis TaxID=136037 RepID=UPI000B8EC826|nr:uncharacterized protein LOC110827319 isoform X2 [Zootermopsis nevadensis]